MRKWFELHKWEIVRMHTKSKVLVGSIKKGNSSTISLTVELFPIYAFELFPICVIRTIYTIPPRTPGEASSRTSANSRGHAGQ